MIIYLCIFTFTVWLLLFLHPYKPYKFVEILPEDCSCDSNDAKISIVIPCRNEEAVLKDTLSSLKKQSYQQYEIILVDDCSSDQSLQIAKEILREKDKLVIGKPVTGDWAGKMWALHQGIEKASGDWILLSDADIHYQESVLKNLIDTAHSNKYDMVSVMATLSTQTIWEKLLIPSFVYFFKIMYPFKAIANKKSKVAAAAGGCVLIKKEVLKQIGGIAAIKNELIDDIALAKKVKSSGYSISLWLSQKVKSIRIYEKFKDIWFMVVRSAFTELKYSYIRLLFCLSSMSFFFLLPFYYFYSGLLQQDYFVLLTAAATYLLMSISYFYCISFYKLRFYYALLLPLIATCYMFMTLDSARRYLFGVKATWKGRSYSKT